MEVAEVIKPLPVVEILPDVLKTPSAEMDKLVVVPSVFKMVKPSEVTVELVYIGKHVLNEAAVESVTSRTIFLLAK